MSFAQLFWNTYKKSRDQKPGIYFDFWDLAFSFRLSFPRKRGKHAKNALYVLTNEMTDKFNRKKLVDQEFLIPLDSFQIQYTVSSFFKYGCPSGVPLLWLSKTYISFHQITSITLHAC